MINLKARNSNITLAQKMMKGDDGGYYVPTVDSESNLSWQPSESDMPAVPSSNIRGDRGERGYSGVYVGMDDPTDDPNILIWLTPDGEVSDYVLTEEEVKTYIDDSLEEVENGYY